MSPRAACRLEALGFEQVYDYELGIADWKAAGLAVDGDGPPTETARDAMRSDVPTCAPYELISEVGRRVQEAGWQDCLVLECDGKVVGRLRSTSWKGDSQLRVEQIMESGPTTIRPDELLGALVERMEVRPTPLIVVSTPQGDLLGVVLLDDARRILAGESPEKVWAECEGCPGQWSLG